MALLEFLAESSRRIKIFRPPVGPAARKCAGLFAQQSPCGFSVCFLASCFVPRLKRKSVHAVFLQKDRRVLFSMKKAPPPNLGGGALCCTRDASRAGGNEKAFALSVGRSEIQIVGNQKCQSEGILFSSRGARVMHLQGRREPRGYTRFGPRRVGKITSGSFR